MTLRYIAGTLVIWSYNQLITHVPFSVLRKIFLKPYLGLLDDRVYIGRRTRFLNGGKVHLGKRSYINADCLFDGRKYEIRCGSDVSIGPNATILTLGHDTQSPDFTDKGGPVTIGDRAWICFGAIVLPGVTIGEGAVVGAGAVVSKDVEPFTIVAGNPARVVGQRNTEINYRF